MKKILLIIGSFLILIGLSACDEDMTIPTDFTGTTEITTDQSTTEEPTTEEPTTVITETYGPTTTEEPTTEEPTTEEPTTEEPTTEEPTTEEPTTEEPTTEEPTADVGQLNMPTNLAINNQILTWDLVDDANTYQVFANGDLIDEVSTNEFDFSSLEDGTVDFTVKAISSTDFQDSPMSLTVTYMINQASEIDTIKSMMASNDQISVSDEDAFATELVNRGMTADELETVMTNMQPLMQKMQSATTLGDFYTELDTFVNSTENMEALVAALVKIELPASIQAEIDYYQEISTASAFGSDDLNINDYRDKIQNLQLMLNYLENNSDEATKAAMIVVNYMMDVQDNITDEWVSDLDSLLDTPDLNQIDVLLAVNVKNTLVNHFKEELPTLDELLMFNQTILTLTSVMVNDDTLESYIQVPKLTQQMRGSIVLFYDYLLMIDSDYMTRMISAMSQDNNLDVSEDLLILQLEYLDTFLVNKQGDITELKNIYSDSEKEDYFFDVIVTQFLNINYYAPDTNEFDDLMLIVNNNIDFNNILSLQTLTSSHMDAFLDRLVETDFTLIYNIFDLMEIQQKYDSSLYTTSDEYYIDLSNAQFDLIDSLIMTVNPIIQDLSEEDYNMFMENMLSFVITVAEIEDYESSNPNLSAYELIIGSIQNTTPEQLDVIQAIFNEIDNSNIISETQTLYNEAIESTNPNMQTYGIMIEIANFYINIYSNEDFENNTDIIVAEIISLLNTNEVQALLGITQSEVDELEPTLNDYLQNLYNQAQSIKDYDYTNLTPIEIEQIQNFMYLTEEVFSKDLLEPAPEFPQEDLVNLNDLENIPRYTGSILYDGLDGDTDQFRTYVVKEDSKVIYDYYHDFFTTSDLWQIGESVYSESEDIGYFKIFNDNNNTVADIIIGSSNTYDDAINIDIYVSPDEEPPVSNGDIPEEDLIDFDDITGVPRYPGSVMVDGVDDENFQYRTYVTQDNLEDIYNMYIDHYNSDSTWTIIEDGLDLEKEEAYISLVMMSDMTGVVIGIYPSEDYGNTWEIRVQYTEG